MLLMAVLSSQVHATPPILTNRVVITAENVDKVEELAKFGRGVIHDIDVHPDGDVVAVASGGGVWVYGLEGASEQLLGADVEGGRRVAFSPDGQ